MLSGAPVVNLSNGDLKGNQKGRRYDMAISKKIRFEVFKRDEFRCGYCGSTPPQVVLEVDHIDPKSKGGKDDINNLLTACFPCNRGKRNILLSKIPAKLKDNLEALKEKEEQIKEYRKFVQAIERRVKKDIADIDAICEQLYPGREFTDTFKTVTLKRFLALLPKQKIIDAFYLAFSKFPTDEEKAIKYFCGVCWRTIKGDYYKGGHHEIT